MSTFDTIGRTFLTPAMAIFHGEPAVYTPKGGSATAVSAVVIRGDLSPRPSTGNAHVAYKLEVLVPIADVPTVNPGGDTIAVKKRKGDAANTTFPVVALLGQDGGRWRLGVG